jgi:hypothetical protein
MENRNKQTKRDMVLKDETLRSEGTQQVTGAELRKSTSSTKPSDATKLKTKGRLDADVYSCKRKIRSCLETHTIGTWNVRTMNQGKLDIVKSEMVRLNIDILGISELKWTGMGHFTSDEHEIYYSGNPDKRKNGVAIIVGKKVTEAVLGYNPKNERMISVRIQGSTINTTIIQVYAPTTGAEEEDTNKFYDELQQMMETTPKKDAIFIIGDWEC